MLLLGLTLFSCQGKREERQNSNTKEISVPAESPKEVPKAEPKVAPPSMDAPNLERATKKKKKTVPQDTLRPINAR